MSKTTPTGASDPRGEEHVQVMEPFTIAVSSQTLFNMTMEKMEPGAAFPFVKALMTVNARLRHLYPGSEELFHIVLITEEQAKDLVRNGIEQHGLTIDQYCITDDESLIENLKKYKVDLYLSEDSKKVPDAIKEGIAAANVFRPMEKIAAANVFHPREKIAAANMFTPDVELNLSINIAANVSPPKKKIKLSDTQLCVAFDGDAVLFSNESEKIFEDKGLEDYLENEKANVHQPLKPGPLKGFLEALYKLQCKFYAKGISEKNCPIRTYLVTARDAASPGARALMTLRGWGLGMNEAYFLSGARKDPYLQVICPHIYFDDKMHHIKGAAEQGITAAHVWYKTD